MPEDHFGERVAERFDERYAHKATPAVVDPIVDFLADLAGAGDALELGVGTGRIALPLAARGVRVHGIDLSDAMVARLRAKPGAEHVAVTVGDFATTTIEGTFSVVYLVANTIMNLTTQDKQVSCFVNAAAHLEPNGCFVVEVLVPRLQRLPPGERFQPFAVEGTHLGFDEYDVVQQGLISHHYWIEDGKAEVISPPFRYVWPSELDLMARLAGMRLRSDGGTGDGSHSPPTARSTFPSGRSPTACAEARRPIGTGPGIDPNVSYRARRGTGTLRGMDDHTTFSTASVCAFLRDLIAEATDDEDRARHEHALARLKYECLLRRRGMTGQDARAAAEGRFPSLYDDGVLREDWESLLSPDRTTYAYLWSPTPKEESMPRQSLLTAVVKAIEKVAAKSDLDAETKKLVDNVVAKAA